MLIIALVVAAVAAVRGMWSPCGLSMLTSLNPVAERARGNRPWLTALWYVLGALAGGALLGAGCAVAALGLAPLDVPGYGIAASAAAIAVCSDARTFGRSLPDHPRQVDERWLTAYRRWIYASGYGVQIGAAFATYIMTAAVYLTAVLAILSGPLGALVVGVTFGLVRGLGVLVGMSAASPERLRALLRRVDALGVPSLSVVVVVEIAAAVVAARVAGGTVAGAVLGAALVLAATLPGVRQLRSTTTGA